MKTQKKISIKFKLSMAFGGLSFLTAVAGGVALHSMSATTHEFSGYIHGVNAREQAVASLRMAVDQRAIAARNLVLVSTPEDIATEKAAVLAADESVKNRLATLNEMVQAPDVAPKGREMAAQINAIEEKYGVVAREIVADALAGNKEKATLEIDRDCRPLLAQLIAATETYAKLTKERAEQKVDEMNAAYATQIIWQGVISGLSLIFALISWGYLSRALATPVAQAAKSARRVASGDLGENIQSRGNDETRDLLDALGDMTKKLREVVARVRADSRSILSATREIAAGNQDLSQRTEEQAASLEETAASLEELTATVRQNAENAQQASELATSAQAVAKRGDDAVGRVGLTMGEISQSAKQIAEFTSIIEGIAFQTNILALNAAVEAARAGEHGRGFAVVATEVRNLAKRSADAAKEIKGLTERAARCVADGEKHTRDASDTIRETNQAIGRVSGIATEIAAASDEQSRGIEQINQAVAQMDQTTQQNAALVEQAAAASRSMEDLGVELNEAVAFFKVDEAG